jgi:hypothetical protein
MNNQPQIKNGYYMHYKNKIYRLVDFAINDSKENDSKSDNLVIYQPQYLTKDFPEFLLWERPKEMFFEDISPNTPRFSYMGKTVDELKRNLKNINLSAELHLQNSSMLEESSKANLAFEKYAIQGFAIHSETLETQILYHRDGHHVIYTMPQREFLNTSGIHVTSALAEYLFQINHARQLL